MALVNCPECGRPKVSDSAVSCPDCGYAIKEHFDKNRAEESKRKSAEEASKLEIIRERRRKETYNQRQHDVIKKLESQIVSASKRMIIGIIITVISVLFLGLILFFIWKGWADSTMAYIACISLAVGLVMAIYGAHAKHTAMNDLELAERDVDEYEKEEAKRAQAFADRNIAVAAQNAAKRPKCPMCGSSNTTQISTLNRAASVAAVGLASSKIGKQYQCKNCKHKW